MRRLYGPRASGCMRNPHSVRISRCQWAFRSRSAAAGSAVGGRSSGGSYTTGTLFVCTAGWVPQGKPRCEQRSEPPQEALQAAAGGAEGLMESFAALDNRCGRVGQTASHVGDRLQATDQAR